jgi:hypothetical protein
MKWQHLTVLATAWILSVGAAAQTKPHRLIETSVCEIVKDPQHFVGKRVQVRARLWSDFKDEFWLNESSSLEIGKVCSWLPADFPYSTNLAGSTAVGTFTGTVVYVPTFRRGVLRSCVRFEAELDSDIRYKRVLNGLVITPKLYDRAARTFVQPESCLLQ